MSTLSKKDLDVPGNRELVAAEAQRRLDADPSSIARDFEVTISDGVGGQKTVTIKGISASDPVVNDGRRFGMIDKRENGPAVHAGGMRDRKADGTLESHSETALREVREEMGYKVQRDAKVEVMGSPKVNAEDIRFYDPQYDLLANEWSAPDGKTYPRGTKVSQIPELKGVPFEKLPPLVLATSHNLTPDKPFIMDSVGVKITLPDGALAPENMQIVPKGQPLTPVQEQAQREGRLMQAGDDARSIHIVEASDAARLKGEGKLGPNTHYEMMHKAIPSKVPAVPDPLIVNPKLMTENASSIFPRGETPEVVKTGTDIRGHVINNSGKTLTYTAPSGATSTIPHGGVLRVVPNSDGTIFGQPLQRAGADGQVVSTHDVMTDTSQTFASEADAKAHAAANPGDKLRARTTDADVERVKTQLVEQNAGLDPAELETQHARTRNIGRMVLPPERVRVPRPDWGHGQGSTISPGKGVLFAGQGELGGAATEVYANGGTVDEFATASEWKAKSGKIYPAGTPVPEIIKAGDLPKADIGQLRKASIVVNNDAPLSIVRDVHGNVIGVQNNSTGRTAPIDTTQMTADQVNAMGDKKSILVDADGARATVHLNVKDGKVNVAEVTQRVGDVDVHSFAAKRIMSDLPSVRANQAELIRPPASDYEQRLAAQKAASPAADPVAEWVDQYKKSGAVPASTGTPAEEAVEAKARKQFGLETIEGQPQPHSAATRASSTTGKFVRGVASPAMPLAAGAVAAATVATVGALKGDSIEKIATDAKEAGWVASEGTIPVARVMQAERAGRHDEAYIRNAEDFVGMGIVAGSVAAATTGFGAIPGLAAVATGIVASDLTRLVYIAAGRDVDPGTIVQSATLMAQLAKEKLKEVGPFIDQRGAATEVVKQLAQAKEGAPLPADLQAIASAETEIKRLAAQRQELQGDRLFPQLPKEIQHAARQLDFKIRELRSNRDEGALQYVGEKLKIAEPGTTPSQIAAAVGSVVAMSGIQTELARANTPTKALEGANALQEFQRAQASEGRGTFGPVFDEKAAGGIPADVAAAAKKVVADASKDQSRADASDSDKANEKGKVDDAKKKQITR